MECQEIVSFIKKKKNFKSPLFHLIIICLAVRYGRVPKKSKEKERMDENKRVTQAEADQSSNGDNESKDLACYEIALTISQAHHDNCSYTNEKIKGINKKPIYLVITTNQLIIIINLID